MTKKILAQQQQQLTNHNKIMNYTPHSANETRNKYENYKPSNFYHLFRF